MRTLNMPQVLRFRSVLREDFPERMDLSSSITFSIRMGSSNVHRIFCMVISPSFLQSHSLARSVKKPTALKMIMINRHTKPAAGSGGNADQRQLTRRFNLLTYSLLDTEKCKFLSLKLREYLLLAPPGCQHELHATS